ncbi:MAG TPA: hypothetical protein VN903_27575 [Polyangia bacterium]|jgi:hypothetical protein|nr:hypothetical protein [Polyangia bacterium]
MTHQEPRSYSSRALTHATSAFVLVPLEPLREGLGALGLAVEKAAGVPRGAHPIWIDLGYIEGGAAEAGGVDQHTWAQWAGATTGAAALSALGSWLGPVGFWSGAAAGWFVGGGSGRLLSATTSRALGCYREAIVAVPNVVGKIGRRNATRYQFVLAMHTDGPVAVWGDETLRYGYHKRLGKLTRHSFESYEVCDQKGEALLRAETRPPATGAWRRPRDVAGMAGALAWMSQPLLGHLEDDRFAVSVLERRYRGARVRVAPVAGRLRTQPSLAPLLPAGDYDLLPLGPRRPWGAFVVDAVEAAVTYPEHRRKSEL